jgi:hypothetical protein
MSDFELLYTLDKPIDYPLLEPPPPLQPHIAFENNPTPYHLLRIIFRTYPDDLSKYSFKNKCIIKIGRFITIPNDVMIDDRKYDHVEFIGPDKERISCAVNNPNVATRSDKVYMCEDNELSAKTYGKVDENRYKLVFVIVLTDNQYTDFYDFVHETINEGGEYNLFQVFWNVLMRKRLVQWGTLGLSNLFKFKRKKKWDCVTLVMACLKHIGILNEKQGILGYSAFQLAHLLLKKWDTILEMNNENFLIAKEMNCWDFENNKWIVSNVDEYRHMLSNFYEEGCKKKN